MELARRLELHADPNFPLKHKIFNWATAMGYDNEVSALMNKCFGGTALAVIKEARWEYCLLEWADWKGFPFPT